MSCCTERAAGPCGACACHRGRRAIAHWPRAGSRKWSRPYLPSPRDRPALLAPKPPAREAALPATAGTRTTVRHKTPVYAHHESSPRPSYDVERTTRTLLGRIEFSRRQNANPAALFARHGYRKRGVGHRRGDREQVQPVAAEQRDPGLGIEQAADRGLAHVEPAGI